VDTVARVSNRSKRSELEGFRGSCRRGGGSVAQPRERVNLAMPPILFHEADLRREGFALRRFGSEA